MRKGSIIRTADGSLVRIIRIDEAGLVYRTASGEVVAVSR